MPASILVIEDEEPIRLLLRYNLEAEGYRVREAEQGEDALTLVEEERPDLIILDWMLPGVSGVEVCRILRAREENRGIPIIMLTARSEESERVRGLSVGADDYVVKPFSVQELLGRIKAVLRRMNPTAISEKIEAGDFILDRATMRVHRGPRELNLSPTEFRLLELMMSHPGRVYTRAQLLDLVWGHDSYIDERTVDVHIGRLRKSLSRGREEDPIRTVRATGYAFNEKFGA
ncbi:MAG: phosphate regulon transcriptional regulatory protein PhoB [Alphaproteobacteria bacterium]|nr:phosphate regulon transcriptional regulatory protein PhoB [Alphaproteobacteria bacterium]